MAEKPLSNNVEQIHGDPETAGGIKMQNTVIVVSASTMQKMKQSYQNSLTGKVPPGAVFAAKIPGCSITGYKSGKVLFQGRPQKRKRQNGDSRRKRSRMPPGAQNLPATRSLLISGSFPSLGQMKSGQATFSADYGCQLLRRKGAAPAFKRTGRKRFKRINRQPDCRNSERASHLYSVQPAHFAERKIQPAPTIGHVARKNESIAP